MATLLTTLRRGALLCLLLAVSGCSVFKHDQSDEDEFADVPGQQLYDLAIQALERSSYERAVELLQQLESRFPFGSFAEQAQLELIYAQLQVGEPEQASETAERFIRLHPEHPNADYAYYMKGIISGKVKPSSLPSLFQVDRSYRDLTYAAEAFAHFAELLARYPDSNYAADARLRMVHLRNLMARAEINAANYYFKRGAWLAATNRGRYVVEHFPETPAIPDALAVMGYGYRLLGYATEADRAVRVLASNYPDHPALNGEGKLKEAAVTSGQKRSTLNLITFGLLGRIESLRFDTRTLYNAEYSPPPRP